MNNLNHPFDNNDTPNVNEEHHEALTPESAAPSAPTEENIPPRASSPYTSPLYSQPTSAYRPPMPPYGQSIPQQTPPPPQESYYMPSYRPYQHPSYSYMPNNNPYRYNSPTPKEKKSASKGFVVTFVCIGMVVSMLLGVLLSSMLFLNEDGASVLSPVGSNSVVIEYEQKGESPVVTDKGVAAYVASLVADTVVDVDIEFVSTDAYNDSYVGKGAGSGVIISSGEEGSYVLTCAHVIDDATKVTVTLKDGTEYTAVSTAYDTQTDIGIIKLNVKGLPCATIGDFSQVLVGEEVVAIGNPLGKLSGSVTNGIISALARSINVEGTIHYNLIQTNVPTNHGNSGGGLFNAEGKLIGITNAGPSDETVKGITYAIPIDDAMEVATDLIEKGYVSGRVQLGFQLLELQTQSDIQKYWKYSRYFTDYGIYIITSLDDRFQEWDHLVSIDSYQVKTLAELKALLLKFEVGQTVTVTVSRIGSNNRPELIDIELVLTEKTA